MSIYYLDWSGERIYPNEWKSILHLNSIPPLNLNDVLALHYKDISRSLGEIKKNWKKEWGSFNIYDNIRNQLREKRIIANGNCYIIIYSGGSIKKIDEFIELKLEKHNSFKIFPPLRILHGATISEDENIKDILRILKKSTKIDIIKELSYFENVKKSFLDIILPFLIDIQGMNKILIECNEGKDKIRKLKQYVDEILSNNNYLNKIYSHDWGRIKTEMNINNDLPYSIAEGMKGAIPLEEFVRKYIQFKETSNWLPLWYQEII